MPIGLSPLLDACFHRRFAASGLVSVTVPLDAGDTTVHCWWSPPPAAPSSKPLLVLLHGFGPPATWQWRRQVGPLSARFRLVVPDLLFFGASDTRAPHLRSEAHQAAAVAKLLGALGVLPGARVSVAGTSYGGFVAYHLARMLGPEVVEKVVVASSDLLKTEADDRALLRRAGVAAGCVEDMMLLREPQRMRRLVALAYHRPPPFLPEFLLVDLIQYFYSDKLEEKMELIKGVTLGKKDEFQLTPLPQGVLIIWGEHDQIFPVEKAFEVTRKLGQTARLEVLKNTGHLPQEEDPKRFNEVLLNFLLPAPKSSL